MSLFRLITEPPLRGGMRGGGGGGEVSEGQQANKSQQGQ